MTISPVMDGSGEPIPARAAAMPRTRSTSAGGRKAEIVMAASTLMRQRGYPNVAMKDIADAAGLTAPALYRHFANKQALLEATICEGLAIAETAAHSGSKSGVTAITAALAYAAVDQPNLWMLLHREARHLDNTTRRSLAGRFGALVDLIQRGIIAERPDLTDDQAELLARAILAALSAPSQYRQTLPRTALAKALATAAARLASAQPATCSRRPTEAGARRRAAFNASLHRREQILQAATTLFGERGYDAVTLDDIGAAVSIAGPSVYNHFSGKSEILAAVLWRGVDWIESEMTRALSQHSDSAQVLTQLYGFYADLAAHHQNLFRVFTVEGVCLPAPERDRIGRAHQNFVERWIAIAQHAQPQLSRGAARAQVCASLCVINDLAQRIHRPMGNDSAASLAELALAVVGIRKDKPE